MNDIHYIYLISFDNGNIIKIGRSNNPKRRFKELEYENTFRLIPDKILSTIMVNGKRNAIKLETHIHHKLYNGRIWKKEYLGNWAKTDYFRTEDIIMNLNHNIRNQLNIIQKF